MNNHCQKSVARAWTHCRRGLPSAFIAISFFGCMAVMVGGSEFQSKQVGKQAVPEEVRARRLVIVDEKGNERAALGIMQDGEVRLELRDMKGEARTWLNPEQVAAPSIGIIGKGEKPLMEFGSREGQPVFVLRDSAGTRRMGAIVTPDGAVALIANDNHGKTRCQVSVSKDGDPELKLSDVTGKPRAFLRLNKDDGMCGLELFDSEGRIRLIVNLDEKGEPALIACDSKEKPIWSATKRE